jgi:RNA recognition motif-containing protein
VTEAIFNMDGAELLGRTLKVSLAQANQISKLSTNEAIWKSDDWFQQHVSGGQDEEAIAEQRRKEEDAKALQEL